MIEKGWTQELIGDVRNIEKRKTLPFEPTPAEEALGISRFKKFLRMFNGKYRIDNLMLPDELFLFSIEDIINIENKIIRPEVKSPSYLHLHNLSRYKRIIEAAARKKEELDTKRLPDAFYALAHAGLLNKSDLIALEFFWQEHFPEDL